jgi:hypothetical protein
MKKIILIFTVLLTSVVTYAQADAKKMKQEQASPEERAQKTVDRLNKQVGLSEEQKTKIYDLAITRSKKMEEIKATYKPKKNPDDRPMARKEIQECRKNYREGVKLVLTKEQKEKLKAKAKEKIDDRKERIDKLDKVKDKMDEQKNEKMDDLDKAIEIED